MPGSARSGRPRRDYRSTRPLTCTMCFGGRDARKPSLPSWARRTPGCAGPCQGGEARPSGVVRAPCQALHHQEDALDVAVCHGCRAAQDAAPVVSAHLLVGHGVGEQVAGNMLAGHGQARGASRTGAEAPPARRRRWPPVPLPHPSPSGERTPERMEWRNNLRGI